MGLGARSSSTLKHFVLGASDIWTAIGGGLAGVIGKSTVAPLSRICILMQVQSMSTNRTEVRTVLESFRKIVRDDGYAALWRGNTAMVLHRFPYSGVMFMSHERLKGIFESSGHFGTQQSVFCSSALSSLIAVSIAYPLDVIRTRLTTETKQNRPYRTIRRAIVLIQQEEGARGFYSGLPLTLLAVIPCTALSFTAYESLRDFFEDKLGRNLHPHETLGCGAASAMTASFFLFPVDLVRRQMQMVGLHGRDPMYSGSFDAVRHVYKSGGLAGFYRGLPAELIKVTPNMAITFMVYEKIKKLWGLDA
jgi:solute carrier family 25 phosphate transporter 23/24/25/41